MLDKPPHILLLNKVDMFRGDLILPMISELSKYFESEKLDSPEIFPISAKSGLGIEAFVEAASSKLSEGPPIFPDDQLSTLNEKDFVAELVREQLFIFLNREVPYGTAVYIESFEEDDKRLDISAVIAVSKNSHKGIVIGKGGSTLKRVGTGARKVMEKSFGLKTNLKLHVKVVENWADSELRIKSLGV